MEEMNRARYGGWQDIEPLCPLWCSILPASPRMHSPIWNSIQAPVQEFLQKLVSSPTLFPIGLWLGQKVSISNHLAFLVIIPTLSLPRDPTLSHLVSINSGVIFKWGLL